VISPHRSRKHLDFVRAGRCAFCDRNAQEAHHAFRRAGGGGMGLKGCDLLTVPLCRAHHREIHKTGTVAGYSAEEARGAMWKAVALVLRQRVLEGT